MTKTATYNFTYKYIMEISNKFQYTEAHKFQGISVTIEIPSGK